MEKHIENGKQYGIPVVVAVNRFGTDTEAELEAVRQAAIKAGASDAVICNHYVMGGEGAKDLANAVVKACSDKSNFKFLYDLDLSIKEKLEAIAKKMYGAKEVSYSETAQTQLD